MKESRHVDKQTQKYKQYLEMDAFVIRSPVPLAQRQYSVDVVKNSPATKTKSPVKAENLACVFCFRETDNEDLYGKKLYYSGGYCHYFCMLFASGLVQQGPENKGCCGFLPYHLNKELKRGKNIICVFCEKEGATIGCCNKKCKNQWHFPCGLENGALNQYFDNFNSYCEEHRPRQHLQNLIGDLDRMCSICASEAYGDVESNDVLRTPCCAKNTLYHRSCLQRYALSSALHHFKCPLCNSVKEFQAEMQKLGIYIPDQDAAWELEPNAFSELMERYNACDSDKCLCPEGRKFTNKRSKLWAIALCDVCGSSGIHLKCAGLKSIKNEWICPSCALIVPPSPEVKKKKKTDLLSYEDWCENRFGRKRPAIVEHDTPSKRRKRDVDDFRTPRYVEISLCLTGDCDGVATNLLQVKPKGQFKKGVVRSLNRTGTDSPDYHQYGDLCSDSSDDESEIFPMDYLISVKDLKFDLTKKPDIKQMNGEVQPTKEDEETDPLKAYQAYKNYHRKLALESTCSSGQGTASVQNDNQAVKPSTSGVNRPSTSGIGRNRPSTSGVNMPSTSGTNRPSTSGTNRPSTSGTNRPSTSAEDKISLSGSNRPSASGINKPDIQPSTKAKPENFEVLLISDDDDDEEPFLDLTSTPDESEEPTRPALPLVCDLTEDGNYDIFINPQIPVPTNASMPGSVGAQRKVQDWLEAGQGEPSRNRTPQVLVPGQACKTSTNSPVGVPPTSRQVTSLTTQDIRNIIGTGSTGSTPGRSGGVPVAKVLPMTNTSQGSHPSQPRNPHAKCTCHLGRMNRANTAHAHTNPQLGSRVFKQTAQSVGNTNQQQSPKQPVDNSVIILD